MTPNTYIHHTPAINPNYTTTITKSMYISTTEAKGTDVERGREREKAGVPMPTRARPKVEFLILYQSTHPLSQSVPLVDAVSRSTVNLRSMGNSSVYYFTKNRL